MRRLAFSSWLVPALVVGLAAGYPLLSELPHLPTCPFGPAPSVPQYSVCEQTFGGLWRSLWLSFAAGMGTCLIAIGLALTARSLRGAADICIEKAADAFFSIPDVLVLIVLGFASRAVFGGDSVSMSFMILALIAVGWAAPTRMVQNRLRSLEEMEFVKAAQAIGASRWRILTRHILPFAGDYLLAVFLLRIPAIVLTESTVSYLGFGLPLDQPSLGKYLGENWLTLTTPDWPKVVPAWVLLALVVLSFQWVGNSWLKRSQVTTQ